ncbi:hypothetical protein KCU81_g5792, partial [Aureobasidium melanogenum]|uniref:ER transporter 6TM N-terminal domain-containing protein n=1 Tax=Aureobasidium melanogenum (strain CBS 110374) TaxID=1043003 RepID=A0A074VVP7_AURM1
MSSSSPSSQNPPPTDAPSSNGNSEKPHENEGAGEPEKAKKPSLKERAAKLWSKTMLDVTTMKMMAKGALAPTICLAAYEATDFADIFTTLGYLVAIMSILSFPIMPRAKFLQTWFLNMLSVAFAACIALLAIYCTVQARLHTETTTRTGGSGTAGTPAPGAPTSTYNSSAAAVSGIWLFFEIWIINTMRAKMPQLKIPCVSAIIFANVSMVYAPQFATMAAGLSFVKRLLEAFFTGFAIGGAVALFVFPVTMRAVVFKEFTGYIMLLRKMTKVNLAYLHSLEEGDMFFGRSDTNIPEKPKRTSEAQAIKDTLAGLSALHGKLSLDLTFAKREIAIGRLGPDDLQDIFKRLRGMMLPIIGLSSVIDVFERIAEDRNWNHPAPNKPLEELDDPNERSRMEAVADWHAIFKTMREPFARIVGDIDEGFEHVLITLQLIKPPKREADSESGGDRPHPGEKDFQNYHFKRVNAYHSEKSKLLRRWCELRGFSLPENFFENAQDAEFTAPDWYHSVKNNDERQKYRARLFIVLYVDYLLDSIAMTVHDFVKYADAKVESGKLSRKRLIVPGIKRLRKWIKSIWSQKQDAYTDEHHGMDQGGDQPSNVYLGDAYSKRKDPEHLPPSNAWEKFGDRVRAIPHFLRSPASSFGFRAACATMCLAIIAYLHDTQTFYVRQRLFWAQIMVGLAMSPSAGDSMFSFMLRIVGTFSAMVASFIIWYIVDGQTAGVIVFFWFFSSWGFFIVLKFPRFIPVGLIFSVTCSLIIGYELQVRKIGVEVATTNGQAYYPIYELAPYRLATVSAGIFVAWVWTIFPYPISEHSELRRDLGSSLYLLANYYSVVVETVKLRVRGDFQELNAFDEGHNPAKKLEKIRQTVFSKSVLLIQGLRTHSGFLQYEVPIGGRFPRQNYDRIINRIQDIVNFASLLSYASQTFSDMRNPGKDGSESQWLNDFRRLMKEADMTSKEFTTLLSLLSASVASGQPLPPYLQPPEPYRLSAKLESLDSKILSVRHMAEPGFAAFAVMQISTKCIGDDIKALLADIKELVGELDFSFHVVSTQDSASSSQTSQDTLIREESQNRRKAD